ncbi:MAG: ABC transporter substrate-binding protein [Candidatus Atribacteria bacterium]|nr:ABC transporter substrate-binding protein [Candidatus Atribacteria bacterium]
MNKKLLILLILVCFLFSVSVASAKIIRIGGVACLTGAAATYGASTRNGCVLAFKAVNDEGGVDIGGEKYLIHYIFEDDQGSPEAAANAFRKLIDQDEVYAILGSVMSKCTLAGAPIAQDASVPVISPTSTAVQVTRTGDYIFRSCFLDPFQGAVVATFSYNDLKAKTAAVIFDNANDYTKGLAEAFRESFEKLGGKVVAYESFTEESKTVDFSAQLTKIKSANPEVIFLDAYYSAAALMAKQARGLGITVPFVGADGWDSAEFSKLGGEAVEGGYFCNHYSPEDPRPIVQNFVKKYTETYGATPDALATLAYDAALILIDALQRAGSTDGAAIRDAISATDLECVSGQITFDEYGDPLKKAAIIKVQDGKFVFQKFVQP